ncbi:hypothetical protein E4T48_07860 [Aureobasidium sp. EXF-10727]|nr:hypothetical protein E4T48_07860 [Aureobasidium sp. EXF-10727]
MLSFPDASSLDLLIPESSDFDFEAHLKTGEQLISRDILLFDNVELHITAYATQPSPPPRQQPGGAPAPPQQPVKLALDSVTITPESKPALVHLPDDGGEPYAVWKTTIYLRYPPQKLHRPSIHLTASAVSKPAGTPILSKTTSQDEYMTSALPTSENLLQSLQHSSQSASSQPYLPTARIHKVAPRATPTAQEARPLRTSSKVFAVSPALAVKVHITPEQVSDILLCLDLESARHAGYGGIQVDEIKTEGNNLNVEPFSTDLAALILPTTLETGDRSTFLYRLARDKDTAQSSIQHPNRPSSVTFQIRAVARDLNSRPLSKRISTTTTRPLSGMTQVDSAGVTFAFTAPEKVNEGETFHLDVFVVNRSSRKKRLAIVAIPKSAKSAQSHHALRFPNISRQDSHHTAEAVLDDRTIYHMQDQREAQVAEIVCLNADVRVGPLPPGACHNVQLEFLTLSTGLVGLAAVHVVDLETRETTQITDLPDIMVSK